MDDLFQVTDRGQKRPRPETARRPGPEPESGQESASGPPVDPAPVDATLLAAYERHRGSLLVWLRARLRDGAAAEDCCQEVYSWLLGELRAGRCPDVPAAWRQRVAHSPVISGAPHPQVVPCETPSATPSRTAGPTAFTILGREAWIRVWTALQGVSWDDRSMLPLR